MADPMPGRNSSLHGLPGGECTSSSDVLLDNYQMFIVPEILGDTCLCSNSSEQLSLSNSECKAHIDVNKEPRKMAQNPSVLLMIKVCLYLLTVMSLYIINIY